MSIGFMFVVNSILFGVGLAMDAFSVSVANGLNEPNMPARRVLLDADVSREKRKQVIDKMAAVVILQGYMESHRDKL